MNTGRKPDNILKLVSPASEIPVKPSELTTAELSSYEAWIVLASENNNLSIRSSDPNHSLSEIYVMLQLISRQIESILMDNDE